MCRRSSVIQGAVVELLLTLREPKSLERDRRCSRILQTHHENCTQKATDPLKKSLVVVSMHHSGEGRLRVYSR